MSAARRAWVAGSVTRRAASVLAVLLTIGAMLLSGCGADPASPAPWASSVPAVSFSKPAPTAAPDEPVAPTLPAAARNRSKAGAVAFVQHVIDVLNYAMATGDTSSLRDISLKQCIGCKIIARSVEAVYEQGGRLIGKGWSPAQVIVLDTPRQAHVLNVAIDISPQRAIERRGAAPRRYDGGRVMYTFTLAVATDGWRVDKLERGQ